MKYTRIILPTLPSHITQRSEKFVPTQNLYCGSTYQTTGSHIASRSIRQPVPKQVTVKSTYFHRFYE
jgi:hypothetical protein